MITVGVIGPSFTGSTILSYALDNLPGVFAAGETHWILTGGRDGNCRECGDNCSIWSPDFIRGLRDSPFDWWGQIAARAKANTVVSIDKDPYHFDKLGWPDSVILTWKDPRAWVASWRRRYNDTIFKSCSIFTSFYERALEWIKNTADAYTVFNLEKFIIQPKIELERISDAIGLQYADDAIDVLRQRPHHLIEGNDNVAEMPSEYLSIFGHGLARDERWRNELTHEEAEQVMAIPEVHELVEMMDG